MIESTALLLSLAFFVGVPVDAPAWVALLVAGLWSKERSLILWSAAAGAWFTLGLWYMWWAMGDIDDPGGVSLSLLASGFFGALLPVAGTTVLGLAGVHWRTRQR